MGDFEVQPALEWSIEQPTDPSVRGRIVA